MNYKKKIYLILTLTFLVINTLFAQIPITRPSNYYEPDAGTAANPYLISSLANLDWISLESNEWWIDENTPIFFRQTANIDASETATRLDIGFLPIGHVYYSQPHFSEIYFNGIYDGDNYRISNLSIFMGKSHNPLVTYIGLFGVAYNSRFQNIHLDNINITPSSLYEMPYLVYAGGIVGFGSLNTFYNCSVSGNIDVTGYNIINHCQLIVAGGIGGSVGGIIENCFTSGNVVGREIVGGLAVSVSTIINSYSTSNLYGTDGPYQSITIGGLGCNLNITQDSYFAGTIDYISSLSPTIGGLVAYLSALSSISHSFWDIELSGINEAVGENENEEGGIINVFGLLSNEMKQAGTYINYGWDFENIWAIDEGINNGYPYLISNPPPPSVNNKDITIKPKMEVYIYPNPFNPQTTISFTLNKDSFVTVDIYNIKGQKIKNLINNFHSAEYHKIVWDGTDNAGRFVGSSIYLVSIKTEEYNITKRIVLMK